MIADPTVVTFGPPCGLELTNDVTVRIEEADFGDRDDGRTLVVSVKLWKSSGIITPCVIPR